MGIFSVDGGLYKFMSRLLDMLKLNCMWILCSIPIVTMGAATTAAYTITLKMVDNEEGYIARPFWHEFKANIKKGSITGVILLVAVYAIYLDFQLFFHANKYNTMFLIIAIVAIYLVYMHFVYAFALLARYENSIINTLRNSYSIGAKFFFRTLLLAIVLVFEVIMFTFVTQTLQFFGILFGPACLILTVSGFAKKFFLQIEEETGMKAKKTEDEE